MTDNVVTGQRGESNPDPPDEKQESIGGVKTARLLENPTGPNNNTPCLDRELLIETLDSTRNARPKS